MKTDKVLEEFLATKLEEELALETGSPAKRTLNDIKISDQLNPLLVDAKLREGNVIEPDKEIEWKDVKEKG